MSQNTFSSPSTSPTRRGGTLASDDSMDPVWAPHKQRLRAAISLASFVGADQPLVSVNYPRLPDGRLVPANDLIKYWRKYDFGLPFCFCSLKTGIDSRCGLLVPGYASVFEGKMCIVCNRGHKCSYFVVVQELLSKTLGTLDAGEYPALQVPRAYIRPPSSHGAHSRTPIHSPIRPTSPRAGRLMSSAAWLISGTTSAAPGGASVTPTRRAYPSLTPTSSPSIADGQSSYCSSPGGPDVPDEGSTETGPEPTDWEVVSVGQLLTQRSSAKRSSSGSPIRTSRYEEGHIDDLNRLYSPPPLAIRGKRARDVEPLSLEKSTEVLLALVNPENPGVDPGDFMQVPGKCPDCHLIMWRGMIGTHRCIADLVDSPAGAAGPSKRLKTDRDPDTPTVLLKGHRVSRAESLMQGMSAGTTPMRRAIPDPDARRDSAWEGGSEGEGEAKNSRGMRAKGKGKEKSIAGQGYHSEDENGVRVLVIDSD